MILNNVGEMINQWYLKIPKRFDNVGLDEYQIMPNHIHFVIQIVPAVGATRGSPIVTRGSPITQWTTGGSRPQSSGGSRPAPTGLGTIVGLFKSECTKQIRRTLQKPNIIIWQRNYYEHIILTENDLNKIRQYIKINPEIWYRDRNNPKNWKNNFCF